MKKLEGDFLGRFLSKDDASPFDESSRGEGTTFEVFYADNAEAPGQKIADSFPMYPVYPIKTLAMLKDNIRKTKTDKVDTFPIAKTLVMQDSYRFISL